MASGTTNGDDADLRAPRRRQPSQRLGISGYEIHRAVQALQDQHQTVQKRTFTRWMNSHLCKWRPPLEVNDLYEDIRDGTKLIALLQILSGERLVTETSRRSQRFGHLTNIQTALAFLENKKIKLVNINPTDVVDGNRSIILGLLWKIILCFQIHRLLPIFPIEELTNNLAFASDLSTSTSSIDSFATDGGGPPKKKKAGARSKWKGAAKKALLQWVKKKTASNPEGFNIAVKDFGPSWRDGGAFNKMIYTIQPELVDLGQLGRHTNTENLEHAFQVAEKHLGIPRLLEPEDVDVDRPDEKSIMTYVAQFVTKYATLSGETEVDAPQVDENTIQYEEVMFWLSEAEEKLAEVHKRFRYRHQDYPDRLELRAKFGEIDDQAQLLRDKWADGQASSISEQQIEQMDNLLNKIDKSVKKWHRELDSRLPGQLGEVGAWLHEAEEILSRKYDDAANEEEIAVVVKKQMDEHSAVFKNKKIMEQMFQRSRSTRQSRIGQQQIPKEQLDDMSQRFSRITTESASRMAQLEFMEAKSQTLGFLATAETMLKQWTVKYGRKPSVDVLLQNYKETIENGNFIQKFKTASEKLLRSGEAYLASDIPPEEKDLVRKFLEDKEAQVANVSIELQSVESMLEEVGAGWQQYEECVARLQPWLDQAEQIIKTKGKKGKDFFHDLPSWVQTHATMNASGNFLIETCDENVSKDVKQQLLLLNGRWKQVYEVCKGYMREEELARMREEFHIGISGLQKWLDNVESTVTQPTSMEYHLVKENLQDIEDIRDEIHQAEEKYKQVSKLAQGLVKDTPQEEVNEMLVTMTKIKDRLLKARGDVNQYIGNSSKMLEPLQDIGENLATLDGWLIEAQEILNEYGNSDKDVESMYQKHQQFFAKTKEQQMKLAELGQALEKTKSLALPGMDTAQLQDKVTEISAKLQLCVSQANEWKPKLKAGTETSREYKKHLGSIQRWIQHAEKILSKPLDEEAPRMLMKEHQEFFAEVDPSLLPAFLEASKKLQESQISESEKSKVNEMTNQMQHEYSSALKRSTQRLLKLKFLEAEDEFSALIATCNMQLDDEENQLSSKTKENEELLVEHKANFDESFKQFDKLMNTMEALCDNLRESVPGDHTWTKKLTELREEHEDVVTAEEEMFMRLTELPEKWQEFDKKMATVKDWVKQSENVMETVHKPVEADSDYFNTQRKKFKAISSAKDEHLSTLEWLSATLVDLAKHSRPEDIEKHQETLMRLTASSKSVINALPITEKRVESVQMCLEYKDRIQETVSAIDRELEEINNFNEEMKSKPVDGCEDAEKTLSHFQNMMNALEAISVQVNEDVNLGKELHADEQCPTFLYSEVSGLEKKWDKLQDVAAQREKELEETVQAWKAHTDILTPIQDFISQTIPVIEARLRLSNINSINQEIATKTAMQDQVDHALKGMKLAEANIAVLSKKSSKAGAESLKKELNEITEKLEKVKSALNEGIAKAQGIKKEWMNCEEEMNSVVQWTQEIGTKISAIEQSQENPEIQFTQAQETVGSILAKSQELSQLEERINQIEGLESPTTLHATLATVRGKWEQVHNRAQNLVTSLGENLSHQEKFESTVQQVEENLLAAEQHFQVELEPCESSEDVQDRKDEHLKFTHTLEQVKLGLTTLQSEAKLIKDPARAQTKRHQLQQRYADIINLIRTRTHNLDEAIQKFQDYEKKVNKVKQYIERCDEIVSADHSALPGDPQKLQHELQVADKLCSDIQFHKESLQELREFIDEIDQNVPVSTDNVLTEINAMEVLLNDLPQQFADRKRIVSAALASHTQYNDTIERYTIWLLNFEKSLRSTTDVYLDDVPLAVNVIKVGY
uniref:nesprin-1-like n=1 Tax=Styela clava TaxID=7725 RepID=UPI00193A53E0|nr:nesprin-1-like [Styela clava]